jgi:hypothetical protein
MTPHNTEGLTRLGLVLQDHTLLARAKADIEGVLADPNAFSNHPHGTSPPEGWPRNVYSRAMLAYLDGTHDERILPFFLHVWNSSYSLYGARFPTECCTRGCR